MTDLSRNVSCFSDVRAILEAAPAQQATLVACQFIRRTPLHDERTTWCLLDDIHSRFAVEIAERWSQGDTTDDQLQIARGCASEAVASMPDGVARNLALSAAYSAYGNERLSYNPFSTTSPQVKVAWGCVGVAADFARESMGDARWSDAVTAHGKALMSQQDKRRSTSYAV